jgi:hypothetical protein
MAQQEYPDVNGYAPSWADISTSFSIGGGSVLEMSDYAAISWTDTVEESFRKGAGGRKLQRTVGEASSEATLTLYRSGLRKLERALAAVAPSRGNQARISLTTFDIDILHSPVGAETEPPFQTKLKGCRLLERAGSHAEGPDADKIEVKISVMQIATVEDGREIVLL